MGAKHLTDKAAHQFENSFLSFIRENRLLVGGETVICAVSGGVDSMVLLYLLKKFSNELNIEVIAAHFNHLIRGAESDRDEEFVKDFCRDNNIPCYTAHGDVLSRAKRTGETVEEAARFLRYGFLHDMCYVTDGDTHKIATAHHANDNFETILMNMLRGTATGGLAGIPIQRDNIIRPLLGLTRREITGYAFEMGIGHVEDSTNSCDDYLRNRIRHQFIPMFESENPNIIKSMVKTADAVRADSQYLNSLANELVDEARVGNEERYNTAAFNKGYPIESRAVYQIIQRQHIEPSCKNIEDILKCIHSDKRPYTVVLPNGLAVVAEQDTFKVTQYSEISQTFDEFEIPLYGDVRDKGSNLTASVKIIPSVKYIDKDQNKLLVKLSTISGKLRIRSRVDGDKIKTVGGTKHIGKLLKSGNIPVSERDSYPIVVDDNGIVGVPGFCVDESRKVDIGDAAVEIIVTRGI